MNDLRYSLAKSGLKKKTHKCFGLKGEISYIQLQGPLVAVDAFLIPDVPGSYFLVHGYVNQQKMVHFNPARNQVGGIGSC